MATENSIMLTERTDELLNRGRSQGFLSTEEVADLMQEGDLSAAEVEEFYAALVEEEITVVEGETRSEAHTSELQSRQYLVCRLLIEKKLIFLCTVSNSQSVNFIHSC